RDRAAKL
nr:Chain B, T. brucei GAPDH PTS1 peptide Ac-DRDAAKL [synthetic construct]